MTAAERTRAGFTKADQRAIADGASMESVVNAHRGMYTAGGRKFTTEGTTKRGLFAQYRIDPETGALTRRTDGDFARVRGERLRRIRQERLSVDEIYRIAGA